MNIRDSENKLFHRWANKYKGSTFIIDGCPNPETYKSEKNKIIFVLKDGNLGNSYNKRIYDQRNELENEPHHWWHTIAKWCYFAKNPSSTWSRAKVETSSMELVRDLLSHHCFIQLKKEGGVGSVKNKKLLEVINKDKSEIIEQLTLYSPNFIIACGNGDQVSKLFNCSEKNRKETTHGIRYWEIQLMKRKCHLVDYCHPSIRVGTKVKGLLASGLSAAINEIILKSSS